VQDKDYTNLEKFFGTLFDPRNELEYPNFIWKSALGAKKPSKW